MTDAYDGLADLIGPLKRAAIDAYVCSDSFLTFGFTIDGDKYTFVHPTGGTFGPNIEEITRPDENGEGGGDWKMRIPLAFDQDESGKYAEEFATVRTRIDEALESWWNLPTPSAIGDDVETLRQANRTLALSSVSAEDGTVTGGGEIAGNLNLAIQNSSSMAGGMITKFKANFMSQLGNGVAGNHAITIALGQVLAAEEKIWEAARQNVVDVVKASTESFNAAAEGGDGDWSVVLKVAGYAVAGAAIFASGGAAIGLAVAGLGITVLSENVPGADGGTETDAPDGDYDSVMKAFEKTLEDLDTAITDEETILDDTMAKNLENIGNDKGSYDLSRPPVIDIDDDSDLGEIRVDKILAREITGTYLPNVAKELEIAAQHIGASGSLGSIYRHHDLGLGSWGPSANYYELQYLSYELLQNLQIEVSYSAKALDLGIDDIGRTDTAAQDPLEKFAEEVRTYRVGQPDAIYNPWN